MIVLDTEQGIFNYRVGAVCIEDGSVLLQGTEEGDLWTLPGGRCEMLEELATIPLVPSFLIHTSIHTSIHTLQRLSEQTERIEHHDVAADAGSQA